MDKTVCELFAGVGGFGLGQLLAIGTSFGLISGTSESLNMHLIVILNILVM